MKVKVAQSCPTLCNPVDNPFHGILQARILEWRAIPFSRGIFPTHGSNPGCDINKAGWGGRECLGWGNLSPGGLGRLSDFRLRSVDERLSQVSEWWIRWSRCHLGVTQGSGWLSCVYEGLQSCERPWDWLSLHTQPHGRGEVPETCSWSSRRPWRFSSRRVTSSVCFYEATLTVVVSGVQRCTKQ